MRSLTGAGESKEAFGFLLLCVGSVDGSGKKSGGGEFWESRRDRNRHRRTVATHGTTHHTTHGHAGRHRPRTHGRVTHLVMLELMIVGVQMCDEWECLSAPRSKMGEIVNHIIVGMCEKSQSDNFTHSDPGEIDRNCLTAWTKRPVHYQPFWCKMHCCTRDHGSTCLTFSSLFIPHKKSPTDLV